MEYVNDCDPLEKLINLTVHCSKNNSGGARLRTLYGHDTSNLATILIRRVLFLETAKLVPKFARDSWRMYAYTCDKQDDYKHFDYFNEGLLNECLVKLARTQPNKSYLKLSFRQLMKFILLNLSSTQRHLLDTSYLLSYMNEIRTSYSTLCHEDRLFLRPDSKLVTNGNNLFHETQKDASFLTNWTIIEAAKYCICNKFAPDVSANEYLNTIRKAIVSPVSFGDKISKRLLINFIMNLDKLLQDRIMETSSCKHTFTLQNNVEQFYKTNSSIFRLWFFKNRQSIASLSLAVDDPAECWRNASTKLQMDLTTKFRGANYSDKDTSLSQTLSSLNSENWYTNLNLLVLSAKQLNDLPTLHGIDFLHQHEIISSYSPLKVVMWNMQGFYQKTFNFLKGCESLVGQELVEFLNSSIELNLLEENQEYIDRLESGTMKDLYRNYLKSRSYKSKDKEEEEEEDFKRRFEEAEQWFGKWSNLNDTENNNVQSTKSYMDIFVPTCLNIISKVPQGERFNLIERLEWLISQDFIGQNLFAPTFLDTNTKIYHLVLDLLKDKSLVQAQDLVKIHSNDLHWNHLLYQRLDEMNLIDQMRQQNCVTIDLIQLRAAKYNLKKGNVDQVLRLNHDLNIKSESEEIQVLNSLLLVKKGNGEGIFNTICDIATKVVASQMERSVKSNLTAKLLRRILKANSEDKDEIYLHEIISGDFLDAPKEDEDDSLNRWQTVLASCSLLSKTKTLSIFSMRYNQQLEVSQNSDKLLNNTFCLDLNLLELLCQSNTMNHKCSSIECATRILNQIVVNHKRLQEDNLNYFTSTKFVVTTTNVWIKLKTNLISLIFYEEDLSDKWRDALIELVKRVGNVHPNTLIYCIIVNRLELQNELQCLSNECDLQESSSSNLLRLDTSLDLERSAIDVRLKRCKQKLTIWSELYKNLETSTQYENCWIEMVKETEVFLKEIRKISFLCGEHLRTLTIRIPRKFQSFLDYLIKNSDPKTGKVLNKQRMEECQKRFKTVCEQTLDPIRNLVSFTKKIDDPHLTKYEKWFCETFSKELRELDYRLNLLANKKKLIVDELEKLFCAISELLGLCRTTLLQYNHTNRQKLYMEMISPLLSRMEPSLIPMPDCCDDQTKPPITIHKISQTVNLIVSKTCPKKLKLIGSDGVAKSFLLKAHEDLRLDQLIMDLFSNINDMLIAHKQTRNKYRLRKYSVTPVSSRSGLIQWIEAPSLCSAYRAWLHSDNGKKVNDELYQTSCSSLCNEFTRLVPRAQHLNCLAPDNPQITDIFYQLLWSKTKSIGKHSSLAKQKPHVGNILKYRAELNVAVFQSIIEELTNRMPSDLVANQMWYKSNNAHSYWLKTREFIHSNAAISMVGYMIGLGDRHPENILLDYNTGEVIHIDYNIVFELGMHLSVPEKVPFRLTPNLIQAFGFAGLGGGFTVSCCEVLETLKSFKSTILHLLAPVNLSFMVSSKANVRQEEMDRKLNHRSLFQAQPIQSHQFCQQPRNEDSNLEMDMCSQESVEIEPPPTQAPPSLPPDDVDDLLILRNDSASGLKKQVSDDVNRGHHQITPPNYELQHNIRTPTKIANKAVNIIHWRIRDKLIGADELVCRYKPPTLCIKSNLADDKVEEIKSGEDDSDLIELSDGQPIAYQVEALIVEATALKNKAAMFEGWVPWI